jgi:hypothetical protein
MSSLLTYASLMNQRDRFRVSSSTDNEFNRYDTPSLKFFKVFFYFQNGDSDSMAGRVTDSGGLLAPTWTIPDVGDKNYYMYNSAWSYLKMNCEDERAANLEQFINLLSNISSESPWYFTELSGLDAALERKTVMDKDFKIEDTRPKISIKCLPDAFDDRISTLLDLYRSIVWSWVDKREILPSNLRKFDMGIFIYEQPTKKYHHKESKITLFNDADNMSFKYFELHNCEIDYNSSKGNLGTISNADGLAPEYTIDIHFDDCYETRYNEMITRWMGDMVSWDLCAIANPSSPISSNSEDKAQLWEENERLAQEVGGKTGLLPGGYEGGKAHEPKGFLSNALAQTVNVGVDAVKGLVKKAFLGNLYTFSLSKMVDQAKSLASGDVWSTTRNVMEYVNDAQQRRDNNTKVNLFGRVESKGSDSDGNPIDSLGSATPIAESSSDMGDIKDGYVPQPIEPASGNIFPPKKIIPRVKKLGNLATSNTIVNNI